MNSRITGAMSAPPAVEDGVEVTDKVSFFFLSTVKPQYYRKKIN